MIKRAHHPYEKVVEPLKLNWFATFSSRIVLYNFTSLWRIVALSSLPIDCNRVKLVGLSMNRSFQLLPQRLNWLQVRTLTYFCMARDGLWHMDHVKRMSFNGCFAVFFSYTLCSLIQININIMLKTGHLACSAMLTIYLPLKCKNHFTCIPYQAWS